MLDICLGYVPGDSLEKYWQNISISEKYSCFREAYESKEVDATIDQCPNSCERTRFKVSTSNYMRDISSPGFVLSFLYKDKNVFEKEQEKEVYTWEDFIAGIGGMIGLFCGFSILSIAELFVYLALKFISVFARCCSTSLGKQERRSVHNHNNKGTMNKAMEMDVVIIEEKNLNKDARAIGAIF